VALPTPMTGKFVEGRYLVFYVNLLRYLGMWPCKDGAPAWKKTLNCIMIPIILLQLVAFYITELIYFVINWGNIAVLTEIMCQMSANTLLIFKITYMICRRTQFHKLIDVLEDNFCMSEEVMNRGQESVVKKCDQQVKVFTIFYLCLGFFTGFFWICIPFIDQHNKGNMLPFKTWTPVDISEPTHYVMAYTVHIIHSFIFVIYIPAIGMFIAGIILHACGQFKVLQSSLINLEDIVSQRIRMENQMPTFEARISACNIEGTSKICYDRYNNIFGNKSDDIDISGRPIGSMKNTREPRSNMTGVHMDRNKEIFLYLKECIVHHQIILR
jgi:hypothetical protein